MRSDLRWLAAFGGNVCFLWLVSLLNHHLTYVTIGFGRGPLYVFLLGLPVAFVALRFKLGYALATAIPTAMIAEAGLPLPDGVLIITSAACVCAAHAVRGNFNRFDKASVMLTALIMNLVFMTVLTIAMPPEGGAAAVARLAVDLVVSQGLLAAICGWFFAWQLALLAAFGFDLQTELRDSP